MPPGKILDREEYMVIRNRAFIFRGVEWCCMGRAVHYCKLEELECGVPREGFIVLEESTARFIANAPQDINKLIDYIEYLEGQIEDMALDLGRR